MGGWLRKLAKLGAAAVWTGALGAALYGVDRGLLGSPVSTGWQLSEGAALGRALGDDRVDPSYLPASLRWPPAWGFSRQEAGQGWWLVVLDAERPLRPTLIGTELGALPGPLAGLRGCLADEPGLACPRGWHAVTRQLDDGSTIAVITPLGPRAATRIAEGLRRVGALR